VKVLSRDAIRIGDREVLASAEVAEAIKNGDIDGALAKANDQIESGKKEYKGVTDIFGGMVEKLLKENPDSIFQLNSFEPANVDGLVPSYGKEVGLAAKSGDAFLLAEGVKDKFISMLTTARQETAGADVQYTTAHGDIIDILPKEVGFTLFINYRDEHGDMKRRGIYFLYGKTEEKKADVGNVEGEDVMDKAA
jgi:hypothetical protein